MPPLPLPKLDSRTWQELTDEARALVARSAPGWTDHNVHDPGITLIELFAWLTELELYRLDRLPPAALRGFLRLLGVIPRPAGVATTIVALRRPAGGGGGGGGIGGAGAPLVLPPGFQVCDAERRSVFESPQQLTVSQAWLELDPAAEGTSRGRLLTGTGTGHDGPLLDVTAANCRTPMLPFGPRPRPGHALRLGCTELPAGPGDVLSLYAWTPRWATDGAEAAALSAEEAARGGDRDEGPPRLPAHYRAGTVWEYFHPQQDRAPSWLPLTVLADDTRALTLSGRVVLRGPEEFRQDPADGRFWLRCRLAYGGYECPPALLGIAVNAVEVRHAATTPAPEPLGVSTGTAAQQFTLSRHPVVAASTGVRLGETQGSAEWQEAPHWDLGSADWQEAPHWDLTGPGDPHYLLDPDTGTLTFGDGRVGRVPPAGAHLTAARYRTGSGPEGNVPARRLSRLAGAGALQTVVQPFPATGGQPAEELRDAHGRLLDELARPERGITADDLEVLALRTPGVPVARAQAVAGHHPEFCCRPAAGAVTVVVLPRCGADGSCGAPSPAFLKAVRCYLEPRRPLCTELHVIGPAYVRVTVTATLHPSPGLATSSARSLPALGRRALDAHFDPLTGGTDGRGRPFGRDVLESEVMALLNSLPGVRYVDGLGISGPHDTAPRCGNLPLCPTELALSGPHLLHLPKESP
jgi:predicted phage baseplate assembly protein